MARHESDREDLVKEATAYRLRGELVSSDWEDPVFLGFRKEGACSIYFGSDPVYQFDTQGRLRRAFVANRLYRSEGETLCSMQRRRGETETAFIRSDLLIQQCEFFQWGMHEAIRQLLEVLSSGRYQIREVVGEEELWIRQSLDACRQVLNTKEFLAPKIVRRKI